MPSWKEKRELMDQALKELFVPKLRLLGFKGSYPHFRRYNENSIDIIGIQFSQWGASFYIEITKAPASGVIYPQGKHYPPKTIKFYQAKNRIRIGNNPFHYESCEYHKAADQAIDSLTEGEEWWARHESVI